MIRWSFLGSCSRSIVTKCSGLVLLAAVVLAQKETYENLPLESSVFSEQYARERLYRTYLETPYRDHVCQPEKIHLSPASDVDPESNSYNATVSFVLEHPDPRRAAVKKVGNRPGLVRTTVTYGRGETTEGDVVIDYPTRDLHTKHHGIKTEEYTLLRFHYTSPRTGKPYESGLIHHVLLQNLEAGKQRYWYTIKVEFRHDKTDEEDSRFSHKFSSEYRVQPFMPPLLSPQQQQQQLREQQPYSLGSRRHLRFFLRGSYAKNHREVRFAAPQPEAVILGETPRYEFNTPPRYGAPTSIALVGDLGQTKNSTRTMARILDAAKATDAEEDRGVTNLFVAGDLSYADGDPERWESWLELAEPLLREVPLASVPGNHEVECDKVTRDVFVPYESFFRNPNRIREAREVPPSKEYVQALPYHSCTTPSEFLGQYDYGNAYFSYKQGLVHTIFLNSYASLLEGSKQRDWLVKTALPSVDRHQTPWLLVVFHTPLFTTFSNHYGELNPTLMKASGLMPLLERYKVNLVISGHDHAYLRTKPLDGSGRNAQKTRGTVYWTLGAGGNREGHATYRNPDQPEDFVAQRDNDEFGFGLFFAPNRTHAHLQWMRDDDNRHSEGLANQRGNSALVVRDSVWIENYDYDEPSNVGNHRAAMTLPDE